MKDENGEAMDNLLNSISGDTVKMSSYWLAHFYFDGKIRQRVLHKPSSKPFSKEKLNGSRIFLDRLVRKEVYARLLSVLLRMRGLDYD